LLQAFEKTKKNIRIEDPLRMLTRFALELVTNLVCPERGTYREKMDKFLTDLHPISSVSVSE
jgi:hypothetical protein